MMNEQIREKSLVRNPFDFQYITPLKSVRFAHSSRLPACASWMRLHCLHRTPSSSAAARCAVWCIALNKGAEHCRDKVEFDNSMAGGGPCVVMASPGMLQAYRLRAHLRTPTPAPQLCRCAAADMRSNACVARLTSARRVWGTLSDSFAQSLSHKSACEKRCLYTQ